MLTIVSYENAKEIADKEIHTNVFSVYDLGTRNYLNNIYENFEKLCIPDNNNITLVQLEPYFKWLKKAINNKGNTLIHCKMGISRSVALGIIYMIEKGYTIPDAIYYCCNFNNLGDEKRLQGKPNPKIISLYNNKELFDYCFYSVKGFRELLFS